MHGNFGARLKETSRVLRYKAAVPHSKYAAETSRTFPFCLPEEADAVNDLFRASQVSSGHEMIGTEDDFSGGDSSSGESASAAMNRATDVRLALVQAGNGALQNGDTTCRNAVNF